MLSRRSALARIVGITVLALLLSASRLSAQVRIDGLEPPNGPIAGGTEVAIVGSGLASASVRLDGEPIVPDASSDTEIRFTTPAHDNGYALVQVSAQGTTAAAEFLFVPPRLEDLPPGWITTVAGVGLYTRLHLPAKTANVRASGVCRGPAGELFLALNGDRQILRIRADGVLEPFAGSGRTHHGPNGDGGPATDAWFIFPRSCAVDGHGNVYIPDGDHRIRRVDAASGIITTVAGTGQAGFSGDRGPGTLARVNDPNYLAAAEDGTVYFLDFGNSRIRRIGPDGTIDTIAGTGVSGSSGDGGPATAARIETPSDLGADANGLALDPQGFLYLSETGGGRVRRIDLATGTITRFLPRPGDPALDFPSGLAVDDRGHVFVGLGTKIVEYDPDGRAVASWGQDAAGWSVDGTPLDEILMGTAVGLAVEPDGAVLFVDNAVFRLRRLDFGRGRLETVAGIAPETLGVPGPAVGATLNSQSFGGDLAFLPSGDLLYGDARNLRIFRIDASGAISVYSGTGTFFGPNYGCHVSECAANPVALEADGRGGFYWTDTGTIVHVGADGFATRVAGWIETGYSGDGGPAGEALFTQPWDLALDGHGNLFVADTNNNRIRRIDAETGFVSTVAGGGPRNGFEGYGKGAYCGDGGPALEACFDTPYALAVDPDGNVFVNDFFNHRLRKVDVSGTIDTFSDLGAFGKLLADPYGGLFFMAQNAIRRFLADGTHWVVAGNGDRGFSGDGGPASEATMSPGDPTASIAVDEEGNLYFFDSENRRLRAVRFGAVLAPPDPLVRLAGGSGQTAPLGTDFERPFEIRVETSWGSPAPGVRVDFRAPSSGPSCTFPNGTTAVSLRTDRAGVARATCRAAAAAGSYAVTATPLESGTSLPIALENVGRCEAPTALCLRDERFVVEVDWTTATGAGRGHAVRLTDDTGYFWFFAATNVEMAVKVLDGCAVNGRYWVFAGGLTNVGVTTRVTDTRSGESKVYENARGAAFLPIQDTDAFAACP